MIYKVMFKKIWRWFMSFFYTPEHDDRVVITTRPVRYTTLETDRLWRPREMVRF